ncbi:MAG TPA: hypothetical protein VHB99_04890 [Pirellulales bacterium]|nr:hypothetical protein [Pirellulales bacterium]
MSRPAVEQAAGDRKLHLGGDLVAMRKKQDALMRRHQRALAMPAGPARNTELARCRVEKIELGTSIETLNRFVEARRRR